MVRRLGFLLVVSAALAIVPAASAAYPAPFAVQGGRGLASLDGSVHYVTLKTGSNTRIVALGAQVGETVSRTVSGAYGIATLTQAGLTGGLFHDGSAFVLQSIGLKPISHFVVVRSKDLMPRQTIALKGTFGFDAVSPDGSMLYLIQHTSTQDIQHYIVRACDLRARKLLPGRIADKTQASWIMQGWAVDRVSSSDGRWEYTLYANPGGYPFVHALDTVRGVAHCIGIPWRGGDTGQWNLRLALGAGGETLAVDRTSGGATFVTVDLSNWKISYPN
jgi:hypothetical protein